jgi:hypothetical protein
MNCKYPLIVASVATALASAYANAAVPVIGQAAAPNYSLVMAGSSAAQSSVQNAFQNDVCGGSANTLVIKSKPDTNFVAFSCFVATGSAANVSYGFTSGQIATLYYRSEGGSVVGALPIVNDKQVKRLNLSDPSCTSSGTAGTCTVSGVTITNGPNDSWTGAIVEDYVQLGVTDVEPAQLSQPNDYPSAYATSVWGGIASGQSGLKTVTAVQAVQQVFGIAVNTSGMPLNSANNGSINLSRESVQNILAGSYADWSDVPDALTGNPIATTSEAITIVNREAGSGTRTSANIYFFNYGCGGSTSVDDVLGATGDYYSTGDDLTQANSVAGAITYASIDNLLAPKNTAYTNLTLATLNGVTPSTLAAATGQYDYWYEATLVPGASARVTGNSINFTNFVQGDVPNLAAAPLAADINVIPFLGTNTPAIPLTVANNVERTGNSVYNPTPTTTATATLTIYVNPYTRNGSSCTLPAETNE